MRILRLTEIFRNSAVKTIFLSFFYFITITVAFGQTNTESVDGEIDPLGRTVSTDTQTISSIPTNLPLLPDSLLPLYNKLNSVRDEFNQKADSLQNDYQIMISKIDTRALKINDAIDSLQNLKLPIDKYTKQLDSLNQLRQKSTVAFNSKVETLKGKTIGRLKDLNLPPQYNTPLQQVTSKVDGFDLNGDFVKIPQIEVPGFSIPRIEGIGDIGDMGSIQNNFLKVTDGDLGKVTDQVGHLGNTTDQIGSVGEQVAGVSDDIKNISKGNLNDVQQLHKTLEEQATKIDGVQDLQKQTGAIDEYKGQLDALKDPNAFKEQAMEKAKEVAIDHFAGKQEQLKSAMEKISKFKQKYSSVSSIKDLPKRPPNAMKGKPLIERLLPGIGIQLMKKNDDLLTDFNPYVGYRFTGRLTGGLGWNQRISYNFDKGIFIQKEKVFGPRIFSEFKLGKGFSPRAELEMMNTFVPSNISPLIPDTQSRQWVLGAFVGMKREYRFFKNVNGTAMMMLNVFNRDHRSPYADVLNVRFGFEFPMKKKIKKTA